ncbi:MAG: thioredoxin fold domain-containing protein [Candidatus Latescibacteria bacterium]|nr:thioredoxin fold domain-containing protein [Candidatus Latescibacterota bacterium]
MTNSTVVGKDDEIWYDDWDAGIAVARTEKKPVLVDFFSDGCGACKAMHEKTFTSPEIKNRFTKDWVCIKINTFHGYKRGTFDGKILSYNKLAEYFRVQAVPTFLFIDKEGKPVQSVLGYKNSELFGQILDYMKNEVYKKGLSFNKYREGQNK